MLPQIQTEVGISNLAALGDEKGVAKKRFGVLPNLQLLASEQGATKDQTRARERKNPAWKLPTGGGLRRSPGQPDEQANERQISVTVRHGLRAGLNQAYNRHQHSEKPEPAQEQIPSAPPQHRPPSNSRQQQTRRGCLPRRPLRRQWIEDRQTRGPDRLEQIKQVGDRNMAKAHGHRQVLEGCQGLAPLLNEHRYHRGTDAQPKQRKLLPDRGKKTFDSNTPEWPIVQKQHDKGQSHEHRLAHQDTGEKEQGKKKAGRSSEMGNRADQPGTLTPP